MAAEPAHACVVLIGADHVGKSAVLHALLARGHQVASCDDDRLDPSYAVLAVMREAWERATVSGRSYSREFLLSGLQIRMLYLRDEIARCRSTGSVLVDSYAYKVLAKCRLRGLDVPRITASWRAFAAPDLVLVLHAADHVLWKRAGRGSALSPFEHYGNEPTRAGYLAFQHDLLREMQDDTRGIPTCDIDGSGELAGTCRQIEHAIDALRDRSRAQWRRASG
jgi:hypothetical protein